MDPVLASIVAAVTAGAVASAKDVASTAIKDAYAALKAALNRKYQSLDLDALKKDVIDNDGGGKISEDACSSGLLQDVQIRQLVEQLKEALLQNEEALKTVGVSLRGLKGGKITIQDIVGFDDGVRIENSVAEELNIGGVFSSAPKKKTMSRH